MKGLGELFSLDGRVSRGRYAAGGAALLLLKCCGEFLVLRAWLGRDWTLLDSLVPLHTLGSGSLADVSAGLAAALLCWNFPFVWLAAALTRRRARDAALPPWVLFPVFLPVAGYLALLLLALWPTKASATGEDHSSLASALLGVGFALVIAPALAWLLTLSGWAWPLALLLSCLLGLEGGYLFNREGDHGLSRTTTYALFLWSLALFAGILASVLGSEGWNLFFLCFGAGFLLLPVLLGAHFGRGLALAREGRGTPA